MEHKIRVVGIGPGSPDYLLPIAKRIIDQATVIAGSKRALDTFAPQNAKKKVIGKNIEDVLAFIQLELAGQDVVVMVSGDPGFYSLLPALRRRFPLDAIRVTPGIGSLQLAFARIADYWQDALLLSMHGRKVTEEQLAYKEGKKLGILTDKENNPAFIARYLLTLGWPPTANAVVCNDLSYLSEDVLETTLQELSRTEGYAHCVLVVKA
ncbi:hypothetical protein P22_0068 [Propionispora sp. 2/2-37]|uniref:precorrin-6y C5,15-methyltransferase (decarboxylating) subunit CbiE n=1 Tax=Propionispora sp. 2/2-37 TaxID=1677858 RepID=UPI0006BB7877|nr:precorrin-6y C5,15-methyltransferase (decarboxylating) subunit CbiE [Propionispora sp. 2/2-37]CUH94006.1 hypothetical protein P22_0068 [Propionispora sp. 2/2-37]